MRPWTRIIPLWLRREPWTVDTEAPDRYQEEGERCDGRMDSALCRMWVRDDASEHGYLNIIGHEVAHYVQAWTGWAALLEEDQAEGLCDAYGKALIEFVAENPMFCAEIWRVHGTDLAKLVEYLNARVPLGK